MNKKKCKLCRRLGEKFLTRGDRCSTVKCSALKKRAPKKRRRPGSVSEFGIQLNEKQKMKILYSLRERQFKNYITKSINKKNANASEYLMRLLETRLDNVIFRMGLAPSRDAARQLVSHGHIIVNGKKVNIPSYQIKLNDKITIKDSSRQKKVFEDLNIKLKKYKTPEWINLDKEKKEAEILSYPTLDANEFQINTSAIIEFYLK